MLAAALAEHFAEREELAEHAGPRATGANPPHPIDHFQDMIGSFAVDFAM